ncbi:MAG: hypothetical protein WBJ50_02410, partial [Smithellaceae bacterium]
TLFVLLIRSAALLIFSIIGILSSFNRILFTMITLTGRKNKREKPRKDYGGYFPPGQKYSRN